MNALSQGFYTSREAADLIEVGDMRRIKGWLDGYPGSRAGPLLSRDYHSAKKRAPQELSFYDLIEVRFVEFFRDHGVKVSTLRNALEVSRDKLGERPFASCKVRFYASDDGQIYVRETDKPITDKGDDSKLWNLVKQQFEIVTALHAVIEKGLVFDPGTERARIWRPRVNDHPKVLIDPLQAYGKPIVESGVPTATIFDTWTAEGEDYGAVKDWYEISPAETRAAIAFEQDIRSNVKNR